MNTLIMFAFAIVTVSQAQLDVIKLQDKSCLFKQCEKAQLLLGGLFTTTCGIICNISGFKAGKCSTNRGQDDSESIRCICDGEKGDASLLLNISCNVACTSICSTCRHPKGSCSKPKDGNAKNSVMCSCAKK